MSRSPSSFVTGCSTRAALATRRSVSPLFPLRSQLGEFLLLFGGEHAEDLGVDLGAKDRTVPERGSQRRALARMSASLTRLPLSRRIERALGLARSLRNLSHLVAVRLRDGADLFLLRVAQLELPQSWKTKTTGATRTTSPHPLRRPAGTALRLCHDGDGDACDQHCREHCGD